MAEILRSLNREWSAIADSPSARRALMRWSATHRVFTSAADLDEVIDLGYDPDDGPEVRRALAVLAPADHVAARTLLQGLLGGLCNLAHRVGRDDDAVDDIVRLAWERIRTYPASRPGSVSANVVLDVRKRYRREQDRDRRTDLRVLAVGPERSAENYAIGNAVIAELIETSRRCGVSSDVLGTIIRSRAGGESMADLAAEQNVSVKVLWHRRWRGEARLRAQPIGG